MSQSGFGTTVAGCRIVLLHPLHVLLERVVRVFLAGHADAQFPSDVRLVVPAGRS